MNKRQRKKRDKRRNNERNAKMCKLLDLFLRLPEHLKAEMLNEICNTVKNT